MVDISIGRLIVNSVGIVLGLAIAAYFFHAEGKRLDWFIDASFWILWGYWMAVLDFKGWW